MYLQFLLPQYSVKEIAEAKKHRILIVVEVSVVERAPQAKITGRSN